MLGDYLAEAARKPWEWGRHDCCTFLADWCVANGYPDPMAFIRGYASEGEVIRHLTFPGLPKLAAKGFRSIGLKQTRDPQEGDVGIIERPTDDASGVVCAIRVGDRWASRIPRGLVIAGGDRIIKAWSIR